MNRTAYASLSMAALIVAGCLAAPALAQTRAGRNELVQGGPAPFSFAPLVRRVAPAVVNIGVAEAAAPAEPQVPPELRGTPFERQFRERNRGRRGQVLGAGSGFIIDPSGVAITNNHVVTGAATLEVHVPGEERPRNARALGASACSDLAVIDIDGDPSQVAFESLCDIPGTIRCRVLY